MQRLSDLLEYLFLRFFTVLVRLVPFPWLDRVAAPLLGRLLFLIPGRHSVLAVEQIGRTFPERSPEEAKELARNVCIGLVRLAFEFCHLPGLARRNYVESHVRLRGFEVVHEALRAGKGLVVITSHLGNWELEGAVTCTLGLPLNAVYYEQSNKRADAFFNKVRRSVGIRLINKRNAVRETLKALGRNELVAFLSDQDAGRDGVFVEFFGRPASTAKGPVYFALKTGAPLILAHFVRTGNGSYDFLVEPVPVSRTGDFENDVEETTKTWSGMLERMIRQYPDQWFGWVHRRWKTPPPTPKDS